MDTSQHNLPPRRKRFIGRGHELESLDRALADYQLVTIVGGGGMGKTRLAMHYGESTERFDRLVFCELTEARSVEDLTTRVAASLELDVTSSTRPAQVGISLSRLDEVLLIVDNLEQVVEPAAHAIGMWMEQAPNVTFLATSREPLHLRGEYRFELAPLSDEEAMELFEHRAQRARPDFAIDDDNRRAVEHIIDRLDALPLAIELAACRINVMSPADILERLQDEQGGLDTLARRTRGATNRHQTMYSTVQWSWDLLDDRERRVLAGASVFRGGFDLDAAEAVLSTGDDTWIGDVIESLADKSLISTVPPSESRGNSGRRFELFETISFFAAKKLSEEERWSFQKAHAHYYVELLEDHPVSGHLHEADNIEQAFRAAIGEDDSLAARAALAAYRLLRVRGAYHRIFEIVDRALEGDVQDPTLRYQLYEARSACCFEQGDYTDAIRDLERGLEAADAANAPVSRAYLLYRRATAILAQGRPPDARGPLETARELAQQHRSARGVATVDIARSVVDFKLGYFDQARERLGETLETAYRDELYDLAADAMVHLARCETEMGELDAAATRLDEADRTHPRGDRDFRLHWLEKRGILAWTRGRPEQARRYFDQALDEEASIGDDRRLIAIRFALSALEPGDADVSPNTHLRDALEMVRSTEDKAYRIQARTRLAVVRIHHEVFSEASRLLAQAAEEADQLGDERAAAHIRAWWGVAEAGLGNAEHSERLLDDAHDRHRDFNHEALADDVEYFREAADVLTDPSKMAQSREDTIADIRTAANTRQFEPQARLWRWPCYDHLAQLADILATIAEPSAPQDAFCAARDGATLMLPDGETIDLSSREALRRIVAELARRRDTAPGRGLSVDKLLDAGWPEAKVTEDAGKSRVYTAIRNLRSKGLEDILLTGHDGYFLDPDVPFEWLD